MSLRFPAAAVLALLVAVLCAGATAPASAHATLVGSDPKDGASLGSEPSTVTITFNEDVSSPAQLQVTAPDGTTLTDGEPSIDGTKVRQSVGASGQAGTYTLAYRVVSADGHPVSGELTYQVAGGKRTDASDAADDESFLERHGMHLVLGAIAVLIALVLLLWPWIRRRA